MSLTIDFNVCVTVGRSDMLKFTEGSWQGSFTLNNEKAVRTLKPSSEQKKYFEIIPSRPEFSCKFAGWSQLYLLFLTLFKFGNTTTKKRNSLGLACS